MILNKEQIKEIKELIEHSTKPCYASQNICVDLLETLESTMFKLDIYEKRYGSIKLRQSDIDSILDME